MTEARRFARRRQDEYNEEQPHSSLNYQTPSAFAPGCAAASAPAKPALEPRHTLRFRIENRKATKRLITNSKYATNQAPPGWIILGAR